MVTTAATPPSRLQVGLGTPFEAAIDHLRRKLNLPTERWDDIQRSAHDRAFIVAGAAKADLLQDLHRAVETAVAGGGLAAFRKEFDQVVARHGWTGWTGEGSAAGRAWRTATIYRTNLLTSYAAGRWRQLTDPDQVALTPVWRYRHAEGVAHPRPLHQAWNGLTLRWDHPFWRSHFPPNGWGCHCKVFPEVRPAAGAPIEPPAGWDEVDEDTGAPLGIDKGFDYAPGENAQRPLQQFIDAKLIKLDAPIGGAMWHALKPALLQERAEAFGTWARSLTQARGESQVVGAIAPEWLAKLAKEGVRPATAELVVRDADVLHAHRDAKKDKLPWDWYQDLPLHVDAPSAVILDKTVADRPALLYVFTLPGKSAKLVLSLDYVVAVRNSSGKKDRQLMNVFKTGKLVDLQGMVQPGYVWLKGRP